MSKNWRIYGWCTWDVCRGRRKSVMAGHARKTPTQKSSARGVSLRLQIFLTSICGECPVCSAGNMDSRLHRRKATVWPLQPGTRKRRCGDGRGGTSSALTQEGRKQAQQNIYFLGRIMEAGGLLSVIRHNTNTFICPHLSRQGQETLALCSPINNPAPARGSIVRVFVRCVWSPGDWAAWTDLMLKGNVVKWDRFPLTLMITATGLDFSIHIQNHNTWNHWKVAMAT